MGADRLQNLMILNCYKDVSDEIDINEVMKQWALLRERRINL